MPEWNEEFSRGMVVTAHPYDAEFGCSGTVAKWCAEGWEVVYVLCTDGSKGTSDRSLTSEDLARIRRQEQIDAGKVLGLKDVVFLDHEDSKLQPTLELRRDVAREIRRHRPDVLICPNPVRSLQGPGGHPDHLAAGEAALSAVFPTARDHMTFPELLDEGLEPHKTGTVLFWGTETPNVIVDIGPSLDAKARAVKSGRSRTAGRTGEEIDEFIRRQGQEDAGDSGADYAEAFRRIHIRR